MPIFYQQDIDQDTRLAIWHITEPEEFFTAAVPLQREITHPQKRLQHLAGRYLLRHLFPDFPIGLICIADTRKPFLAEEAYHFSISHCREYAAALVSGRHRTGIDIEFEDDKVERIRHKFISPAEELLLQDMGSSSVEGVALHLPSLLWSVKEAVFKWYGKGGVDFRQDILIRDLGPVAGDGFRTRVFLEKEGGTELWLRSRYFNGLWLSWVV